MSPDSVWERLEQVQSIDVFQRLDEEHPADFYAALDAQGRRGLILMSIVPLTKIPDLENLAIECMPQQDGRWRTCVWLTQRDLQGLFSSLTEDILNSSRTLPADAIPQFMSSRILRWRDLLAGSDKLGMWQLRGLVAELVVLKRLCHQRGFPEAVEAWQGPLGAAHDFVFQGFRFETKAIGPTARRIRISSADQLDAPSDVELSLIAVVLAASAPEADDGFTAADLIAQIRSDLKEYPQADEEFGRRLAAAGLPDADDYRNHRFRVDAVRKFVVGERFPRIIRSALMHGIDGVSYDVALTSLADFERALEG